MRDIFPGFFRPSSDEFKQLWQDAIVAVDANILLHIYRYSPLLRDSFLALLEKVGDRLWVPHRAAYEFSKNRLNVISEQEKAYDIVCEKLDVIGETVRSGLPSRHVMIDSDGIKERFAKLIENEKRDLREKRGTHPVIGEPDAALQRLDKILDGKIGPPLSLQQEQELVKEGETRYKSKIPPGFRDERKNDDPLHRYGDLLVWKQLLAYAKEKKAHGIIFATDDSSDDWWWREGGKTLGPHPLLLHEAMRESGCRAYLYSGEQFIRFGLQQFDLSPNQALINEAVRVSIETRANAPERRRVAKFLIVWALAALIDSVDLGLIKMVAYRVYRSQLNAKSQKETNELLSTLGFPSVDTILKATRRLEIHKRGREKLLKLCELHNSKLDGEASRTSGDATGEKD